MVSFYLALIFGVSTAILVRREIRRHRRRNPRHPIPTLPLSTFDPEFEFATPDQARDRAVLFIANPENLLQATTSDLEAYVLASLARHAKRLFEFGTCSGRTTFLWAANSAPGARITTLTLPPDDPRMQLSDQMTSRDIRHATSESTHQQFVYSGSSVEHKIEQLFCDSAALDTTPYHRGVDLIFIDGGHSYAYVKNDSEKAFEMVAPGGLIIWHDYRGKRPKETIGVYRYLNELSDRVPLCLLKGTSLVVYRAPRDIDAIDLPSSASQRSSVRSAAA